MLYKEDWEDAQERFKAWWQGEVIDRVAMSVTAPNGRKARLVPPPEDDKARWTDTEYLIASAEAQFETTYYGGEAFPCRTLLIGWAFLGGKLHFDERTIWLEAFVDDWADYPELHFDPQNEWWQITKGVTKSFADAGAGKFFVTLPTVGSPTDTLSGIRGPRDLCTDFIDRPDKIKEVRDYLLELWFQLYDELHAIIQTRMEGSSSWLPLWSPGKSYTIQCDFSCMISPDMFEEFVVPELQAQSRWLDHTLYHLDGPGAIQHLDALLNIPELHGIQWVPGSGAAPAIEWMPLLKRIQSAGKLLHISIDKAHVETALSELSPKGLFLATSCASIDEAKELLKMAEKWTARRVCAHRSF